jgi:tetratricopeptide (TPR) repeat protein
MTPSKKETPQTSVFNPRRLSDADLERSFIARMPLFHEIFAEIIEEKKGSYPQMHLLIGQRGMGKTTMLLRIALELSRAPHNENFVPLTFSEEQYVEVDRLSKFWLNCLDSLADTLEHEGRNASLVQEIDDVVANLTSTHKNSSSKATEEQFARAAQESFTTLIAQLGRRPVLFIDNFHLLMGKLRKEDYTLRDFFMKKGAPLLIAASTILPEDQEDYGMAFYEHFKICILTRLLVEEMLEIMNHLATNANRQDLLAYLRTARPRLAALRDMTGGNPRITVLLFDLFAMGVEGDAYTSLESLLDLITPLYQSRLDQLSEQAQGIFGALARHWAPMSTTDIVAQMGIPQGSINSQIGRLEEVGLVEKTNLAPDNKSKIGYQISERFFNIWYLMRFSTRRQRTHLTCLVKFLEDFYSPEEKSRMAHEMMRSGLLTGHKVLYAMALSEASKKEQPELAERLQHKAQLELIQQMDGVRTRIVEILDPHEISPQIYEFAELKKKLDTIGKQFGDSNFTNLILGSLSLLPGGQSIKKLDRNIIANHKFTARYFSSIMRELYMERDQYIQFNWLINRMREGIFTSWDDVNQINHILQISPDNKTISIVLLFIKDITKSQINNISFERIQKIVKSKKQNAKDWFEWGNELSQHFLRYEESEQAYNKAIEIDPQNAASWNNLGSLLQGQLGRYEESEQAYNKAIEIDPKNAYPWNNLGHLFQDHLGRYEEAENAYKKAIEIDPKDAYPWFALGNLFQNRLGRYEEAENAYKRAIEIDPKDAYPWNNLGHLFQIQLGRYEEAENAYKKAIEIDSKDTASWNNLGNLLQDYLGRYEEAEQAYKKAIEIDPKDAYPRNNLVFLYRDNLNQFGKAKETFDAVPDKNILKDSQHLHQVLFAAYENNWGIATEALKSALEKINFNLPPNTRGDWFLSMAVIIHLGFGEQLLEFLESEGVDIKMLPFYAAIRAVAKGDKRYLNDIPFEARPVAEKLYEEIEKRRSNLPPRPKAVKGK